MPSSQQGQQHDERDSESAAHEERWDEKDAFLGEPLANHVARPSRRVMTGLTIVNLVLLLTSVALVWFDWKQRRRVLKNEQNMLLKMVDAYSPVYDQIPVALVETTINGSLLDDGTSIYRQPPSPEVDAAWEAITHQLPHAISRQDVLRLGKDPARTAQWPADWGFGADAYIAELDIVHTVHCLNALRRDIHWRHYFADRYPDGRFPDLHRTHTDHCIHIILQNLMCSANGDIVTNVWVEGQLHPFPDFNVRKKCRDYRALVDWHHSTQIDNVDRYLQMRRPAGHTPWKMSQAFHDLFNTGLTGGTKDEVLN